MPAYYHPGRNSDGTIIQTYLMIFRRGMYPIKITKRYKVIAALDLPLAEDYQRHRTEYTTQIPAGTELIAHGVEATIYGEHMIIMHNGVEWKIPPRYLLYKGEVNNGTSNAQETI
jgi:hypothetical protein